VLRVQGFEGFSALWYSHGDECAMVEGLSALWSKGLVRYGQRVQCAMVQPWFEGFSVLWSSQSGFKGFSAQGQGLREPVPGGWRGEILLFDRRTQRLDNYRGTSLIRNAQPPRSPI
jgi:hypothetical protein